MQPILLRIRRKTKVPTKNAIVHQFRSDWKKVGEITYNQSIEFFKRVKLDSQFAKWLRDRFGVGIYSIIFWQHGREGMGSFMKVDVRENSYVRLRKKVTTEEQNKNQLIIEKRRIDRRLKDEVNQDIRNNLQEDLNELNENIGLIRDIIKLEKGTSCYPYLKTLMPIFREHGYDEEYRERPINIRAKIIRDDDSNKQIETVDTKSFKFR